MISDGLPILNMEPGLQMSVEDWNELYALAAAHYPNIYKALVRIDHTIHKLVVSGVDVEDITIVSKMRNHDSLIDALRILRRQ